jgi:hypothetical protein
VTQRPDDEHLNSYELWARDWLEPLLGRLRVVDRKGGRPGLHDFEADLPNGSTEAIEVTSEVESKRLDQESSAERRFSSFTLQGSRSLWLVGLTAAARVNAISHEELHRLLDDMDIQGRRSAHDLGDYRDPFVERLRALGIESVYAVAARAGYEGTVMVRPGVLWRLGMGWTGHRCLAS